MQKLLENNTCRKHTFFCGEIYLKFVTLRYLIPGHLLWKKPKHQKILCQNFPSNQNTNWCENVVVFFFNETKWQPLSKRSCKASHWLSSLLALENFPSKGLCLFFDSEKIRWSKPSTLIPGPRPGYIATSNWFPFQKSLHKNKTKNRPTFLKKYGNSWYSKLLYKGEGTFSHPTQRDGLKFEAFGDLGAEKPLCQTPSHAIPFHRSFRKGELVFYAKVGKMTVFSGEILGAQLELCRHRICSSFRWWKTAKVCLVFESLLTIFQGF